jgi:RNA 2',3'-cyclic 3'-phosphodiesterase
MRLFLGIMFDDEIKNRIRPVLDMLSAEAVHGKATDPENVHLTLIFLGDIEESRVDVIKKAIDVDAYAFDLWIRDLGHFESFRQGSTYYLGVEAVPDLLSLEAKLSDALHEEGFKVDRRTYHPHVTIGRKIELKDEDAMTRLMDNAPSIRFRVDAFHLVKSVRTSKKPVYETLMTVSLKDPDEA